jgi:hypothetical protein
MTEPTANASLPYAMAASLNACFGSWVLPD